jgi:hypothetical protein
MNTKNCLICGALLVLTFSQSFDYLCDECRKKRQPDIPADQMTTIQNGAVTTATALATGSSISLGTSSSSTITS